MKGGSGFLCTQLQPNINKGLSRFYSIFPVHKYVLKPGLNLLNQYQEEKLKELKTWAGLGFSSGDESEFKLCI